MAQIVGLPCARCGDRIGNDFESAFCQKCANPVHNGCRSPASSAGACSVCGTNLAEAARRAEERELQRREEEAKRPPPPPLEVQTYLGYYQFARWALASVICVVGGVVVLTIDQPGTTFAGIGAIVAGVALGVFAYLVFWNR